MPYEFNKEKRDDFSHLKIVPKEHGCVIMLDEKELYGVTDYSIEHLIPGKAKLSLEITVKFP